MVEKINNFVISINNTSMILKKVLYIYNINGRIKCKNK